MIFDSTDLNAVNTVRFLSVDMVQKAKSGHPGLPLGAAPAAYALWAKALKHDPLHPDWPDRDRFVLSAGHGSAMLYSLLHLFGYGLPADELKKFRQFDSLTPGHPEYGHTPGVEITTGPLGQGIANAVGFAWAESCLAAHFNRPDFSVADHYTYALCGDGCMMEGISSEAASLAGTLKLGKLIVLYDSNDITIDGPTEIAFQENVTDRFKSYGWHTQLVTDGNDLEAILFAIESAKAENDRPSLIEIKTVIGYGSPNKQGTAGVHGEPLGFDEIELTKKALGWQYSDPFTVPADVSERMISWQKKAAEKYANWVALMESYKKTFPDLHAAWEIWQCPSPPAAFMDYMKSDNFYKYDGDLATRVSSEQVLQNVIKYVPNLVGGSADLAPSTKAVMKGRGEYSADNPAGMNLHFGVREHAMTAIANAMTAHGGLRVYVSGFFVFSDYMKPAMRLSAMMRLPVIYVMTHDSIGVGEDGPTHEPIEQLAMLRSIPNFTVLRPCDTKETAAAWALALTRTGSPTAIVLTRQNLPLLDESGIGAFKGAYIVKDTQNEPDIILLASGSEVGLIYTAADTLKEKGISARVVSMPSFEIFEEQDASYKESVLPDSVRARLAVEAASPYGWHKYTGLDGAVISIDRYGASAPAAKLFETFGFTVDNVVQTAMEVVKKCRSKK